MVHPPAPPLSGETCLLPYEEPTWVRDADCQTPSGKKWMEEVGCTDLPESKLPAAVFAEFPSWESCPSVKLPNNVEIGPRELAHAVEMALTEVGYTAPPAERSSLMDDLQDCLWRRLLLPRVQPTCGSDVEEWEVVDDSTTSGQLLTAEGEAEDEVRVGGDNGCPDTLVEPDVEPAEDWASYLLRVIPPELLNEKF